MSNVIGYFTGKNKDRIKSILFDLNFRQVNEDYTVDTLLMHLKLSLILKFLINQVQRKTRG